MVGKYNGLQQKILEKNKFQKFIPCPVTLYIQRAAQLLIAVLMQ